jgi:serine protease inhibitor
MYLINALVFDAEWQKIYNKNRVYEDTFHSNDGDQTVTMMRSKEIKYLKDKKATGFIKPYADGYSFVALMPNEGVAIEDYIKSLKGSSFIKTVSNPKEGVVNAAMPKFSSEYRLEMIEVLKALGMTDAFDGDTADFSRLGHSPEGNLYVSNVIHKTYIKVDERGTKAGAATVVEVTPSSAKAEERYYTVTLDRPFVYAVIDNETNLPLFIGTVLKVES